MDSIGSGFLVYFSISNSVFQIHVCDPYLRVMFFDGVREEVQTLIRICSITDHHAQGFKRW